MKNKICDLLKKYKFVIIIVSLIILIGITLLMIYLKNNRDFVKEYKSSYYSFNYNSFWKIDEEKEDYLSLVHSKGANINIQIVSLEDEYKYLSINELLDELLHNIEVQNSSYKLLFKESSYITKNNYEGYKLLYENGESQVMVTICKKGSQLFIFTYESSNNYFDILLDSAQNIIYTFDTINDKFDLSYKLNVDTSEINWNDNQEITSQLIDTKDYEIASKNYVVSFSVPSNFELSSFDSTSAYFDYEGLSNGYITLNAVIRNENIYEYLDNNSIYGLYGSYKNMREGNGYSNFKESIEKLSNDDRIGFIYKNNYTSNSTYGDKDYEEVILTYELDTSHILIIKIKSTSVTIPEGLINKIELKSSKNYSSYIKNKVENGYIICELKEFTDYTKDKIQLITLKVPEKYEEIDKGHNQFIYRNFGLDYDEENQMYKYNIQYGIYYSADSNINALNSTYSSHSSKGTYKKLIYKETRTLNNKSFDIYEGGYTDINGALFSTTGRTTYYVNSKVLFYKLDTGKVLSIEIKGNDTQISDELLNELTNFDIETKNI